MLRGYFGSITMLRPDSTGLSGASGSMLPLIERVKVLYQGALQDVPIANHAKRMLAIINNFQAEHDSAQGPKVVLPTIFQGL